MNKRDAKNEIFALRKKAAGLLQAGDVEGFNCLQLEISNLQRESGAVIGARKEK